MLDFDVSFGMWLRCFRRKWLRFSLSFDFIVVLSDPIVLGYNSSLILNEKGVFFLFGGWGYLHCKDNEDRVEFLEFSAQ